MHNYAKSCKLNVGNYGGDILKKITGAIALILVVIFTFTSCFFNNHNGTQTTTPTESTIAKTDINDFTDKYTAVKLTFGYDGLNTAIQRECYNKIAEKSSAITDKKSDSGFYLSSQIVLSTSIKQEDIFIALTAYKYDNPGDFWLEETFLTTTYSDKVILELCSHYSLTEITEKSKAFEAKVSNILGSMPHGLSEFDRELYLHDYLLDNCSYDNDSANAITSNQDHNHSAFTSYGALVEGKAVCQGYTNALSYLLSCVGIENTSVSGVSQNENHIWNTVKINGNWYYVDSTWDDNAYDDAGVAYKYDYFNLTTNQLQVDHIIGKTYIKLSADEITGGDDGLGCNFNIFIPECNSTEQNYYVQKGAYLTGFTNEDDNQMGLELLNAVQNGEEYFHIYVDQNYLDYSYAVEHLFDPYVYNYQYYVNVANGSLSDCQLDYSASIVKKEKLSVITVKLEYV